MGNMRAEVGDAFKGFFKAGYHTVKCIYQIRHLLIKKSLVVVAQDMPEAVLAWLKCDLKATGVKAFTKISHFEIFYDLRFS